MSDLGSLTDQAGAAKTLRPQDIAPRILITGACQSVGHCCAEVLATCGAELILCDSDGNGLPEVAKELGATGHFACNVASEAGVTEFAGELSGRFQSLDVVINAAGGGYERTLGMYRVSRALIPLLHDGHHRLIVNVPPSARDVDAPIFPYASSIQAFLRLSAALANEVRGTPISLLIACLAERRLEQVLPDPNAGSWARHCGPWSPNREDALTLAWQLASLVGLDSGSRRLAG
jgi:NAD(P)-dependent dehydrogenase (short-subunit alcohol dehydrogenase family)